MKRSFCVITLIDSDSNLVWSGLNSDSKVELDLKLKGRKEGGRKVGSKVKLKGGKVFPLAECRYVLTSL